MAKTRNQSNILNGGETITNRNATETGLEIKEAEGQIAPLLHFVRDIGSTTLKFEPVEIIDSSLELYVEITGNDTTGDGSTATPWATPHKAMEWLHYRSIIGKDTNVTIHVGAGEYTFTESIVSNHPNGGKIRIIGAGINGNRPSGVPIADYMTNSGVPSWGGTGDNVFGVNPIVPARTADQFYNSAGTLPSNADIATRNTAIEDDLSNNTAFIKTRYETIFKFTGSCSGFTAHGGAFGLIDKLAILGDWFDGRNVGDRSRVDWSTSQTACGIFACGNDHWKVGSIGRDPEQILSASSGGFIVVGNSVVIQNFYIGMYSTDNSIIRTIDNYGYNDDISGITWETRLKPTGVAILNCSYGMYGWLNSTVDASGSTVQGCEMDGVNSGMNASMFLHRSVVSGNGNSGVILQRTSYMIAGYLVVSGNGNNGILIMNTSSFNGTQTNSCGNYATGISAYNSSVVEDGAVEVSGNYGYGVYSTRSSFINISVLEQHRPDITQSSVIPAFSSGNPLYLGLGMIFNNNGVGIGCYYGSTLHANNQWWVANNNLHGVAASRSSSINFTCDFQEPDINNRILPRSYVGYNDLAAGNYREVVSYHGSDVAVYGASIQGQSYTAYCVLAGYNSNVYLSADDKRPWHQTVIGGGSSSHAKVAAHSSSTIYDQGSNLSSDKDNTNYYEPARPDNTAGTAINPDNGGVIVISDGVLASVSSVSSQNDDYDDGLMVPNIMDIDISTP